MGCSLRHLWHAVYPRDSSSEETRLCRGSQISFETVSMKASLDTPCFSRRTKRVALRLGLGFPLYVFSTGPVAWATNDASHPAYLPAAVEVIYLPLAPLMRVEAVGNVFYWWTAIVWHGFPAGYTTL